MNLTSYGDLLLLAGLLTDQASLVPLTDSAAQSLSLTVTAVVALTGSAVVALVVVGLLRSGLAAMLRRDYLRLDQAVTVLTDLAATRPTGMAIQPTALVAAALTDLAALSDVVVTQATDLVEEPTDLAAT
ncbi:hypothetical protein PC128_g13730 [Phytophthora cactorum]|nr:hypothetical protein PC120_g10346 [Phytophthora cactorum]KAG3068215.1 hypothetical protein PC121_g10270 [Phytophthora cactorum]KAG3184432.1 hypothetical protein PC128_g13730 [Phytophthora cactorum]